MFYGWWDWRFCFLIAFSSLVDFFIGMQLDKTDDDKKRKWLLITSLCTNLGLLFYFKYTNFFLETFVDAFSLFGTKFQVDRLDIILPVGISFYTFQTLSYTIDIFKKKMQSTKDPIAFFAYVSFFPQLVAGPIERASHLLPQFYTQRKFDYKFVKSGFLLILLGLFKKMVIADRVAFYVDQVYDSPQDYGGAASIIASVLFTFQIYCDFAGYSDIAIGVGRTLGFDFMKNFDNPNFSKSITEFWRRWHISLSTWFRDYIYFPLGGNRKGKYRTYFNLFAVFFISGLWHGAAMNFVVYGAINGFIIIFEKATHTGRHKILDSKFLKPLFRDGIILNILTLSIITFGRIFFRAENFSKAKQIVSNIFTNSHLRDFFNAKIYHIGFKENEFFIALLSIVLLTSFEYYHSKNNATKTVLKNFGVFSRWAVYLTIIFTIIIFGIYGERNIKEFIYFQF